MWEEGEARKSTFIKSKFNKTKEKNMNLEA